MISVMEGERRLVQLSLTHVSVFSHLLGLMGRRNDITQFMSDALKSMA